MNLSTAICSSFIRQNYTIMKNIGKSLVIFILSRLIDLIYFPPLFNLTHSRAREKAVRHFVAESGLDIKKSPLQLAEQSLTYYMMFKRLNMFLLLIGVYVKDIDIFYKTLGSARVTGLDIIERNGGKSIVGVSYHMGPFAMIPVILALRGYSCNVLVRSDTLQQQTKMDMEKINKSMAYLARTYNVGKVQFIDSLSDFSLIMLRKCLRDGEILMIYPDTARESSVSSIPVDFFNTRIAGHVGIAKLCRFTRATVIPFAARWDGTDSIHLRIGEELPITPENSDDEIITYFYGSFEKSVAAHPEQWIQVESYEKLKY